MNSPLSTPAYCRPQAYAAFAEQLPHIETTRGLFRAAFAIAQHERPDGRRRPGRSGDRQPRRNRPPPRPHAESAGPARPPARRAVRRHRLPRQCRRLLRSGEQLLAGCAADASRPADFAGADLQVRRGGRRADGPRHQCAGPFSGGRRDRADAQRRPAGELVIGCSSIRSTAATLLDEQDICRRIAETTGRDMLPTPSGARRPRGRQWLARMLANLQAAFASAGRERDLLAMQELQSLLDK